MKSNTRTLSTESALRLVADDLRRSAIRHLMRADGDRISIDALADQLVADEACPATRSDSVALQLRHASLPKLADAGVVVYDTDDGTVEYRSADRVEAVVRFVEARLE
jgi:hypothetical protein